MLRIQLSQPKLTTFEQRLAQEAHRDRLGAFA
jgi:hypothetical protein